jgi:Mrp family chromosome partitioning ATPase
LAISSVKTLLVDGDVRARSLSEYLGFKDKSGYADGNFEPYRLSENLYFLPVGKTETDIFVAFKNLVEALDHLAGNYLVVIDMAPVGVSPEIKLLEKFAVKSVLVTRYNYTLRDALESIEIEPSLVIFNFVGSSARYYSKYYYKPKKSGFWRFLKK